MHTPFYCDVDNQSAYSFLGTGNVVLGVDEILELLHQRPGALVNAIIVGHYNKPRLSTYAITVGHYNRQRLSMRSLSGTTI